MFKKVLAVALSAAMALTLIGCGDTKSSPSKTSDGEIKLGDYQKEFVVYKDDVNSFVEMYYQQMESYLLSQNATTETLKSGTVKKDSTVNVDYVGEIEVDGKKVKFEGGSQKGAGINVENNASTDGTTFIEGFTKDFAGHKVGDKFTSKLAFPKDYNNKTKVNGKEINLAGKDVWFTFTINHLQKTTTPEKLTDKIIKDNAAALGIPDVKDVKGFKEYVKDYYKKQFILNKVLGTLMDKCEVVSYDKEAESQQFETEKESVAAANQVSFEDYLKACSITEKEWREKEETIESVHNKMKAKMLIMAIAEDQKLIPDDKDYKKEAESIGENMSASVKELESQYGKEEVEYAIVTQRVQDFVVEHVTEKEGTEPTTTAETTTAKKEK